MIEDGEQADAELVALALRGTLPARQQAFSLLVTRHERLVRSMLINLCRNRTLADDLSQDAFLNAWTNLASLRHAGKFRPWLKQLAYRHFLHHYRRNKVEEKYAEKSKPESTVDLEVDDQLEPLLTLCSPVEREMMILCYAFEFTYAEIAAERKMSVGTIKSHVSRAKQKMRAVLAQQELAGIQENSNG